VDPSIAGHYSREDVVREIVDFARGRWLALEGYTPTGERLFLRHLRGKPIDVRSEADFKGLLRALGGLNLRSIYATVNIYVKTEVREDVERPDNILFSTPSWDIDASLDDWRAAIEAAELIVDFLERHGVSKSVYLKWSGEGVHVHVNEKAFSRDALAEMNPFSAAYVVVEYTLRMLKDDIAELVREHPVLKVENVMDLKRVFTVPLSIHRRVDKVAVCFKPDSLGEFDLTWADMAGFKHDARWREYEEGEADQLLAEALKEVKPPELAVAGSTRLGLEEPAGAPGRIGRFQVMALLQAARYYVLTGDLERAMSFGLNRAIFYAWAKHHGRGRAAPRAVAASGRRVADGDVVKTSAAGEEAFVSKDGWFVMGGVEQRPDDYSRQVIRAIEGVVPYERAWENAVRYVESFPRSVLENPQEFYKRVYEPVRDSFADMVLGKGKRPPRLDDFLG